MARKSRKEHPYMCGENLVTSKVKRQGTRSLKFYARRWEASRARGVRGGRLNCGDWHQKQAQAMAKYINGDHRAGRSGAKEML